MRRFAYTAIFLASTLMAACAVPASKKTDRAVPDADKLLVDAGLAAHFWHENVTQAGDAPDGKKVWFVSAAEKPQRAEDAECVARDYTWTMAVDPRDGRGALYAYPDNPGAHNPEIGFDVNVDISKHSVPCDQIDFKDYFLVAEDIRPHEAVDLLQELYDAVGCVGREEVRCGKWKKLNMESYKDDFLRLPELRIFMIEHEDDDARNEVTVKYVLYPWGDKNHEFTFLDCIVRTFPDGSLELDVGEAIPDIVKE